MISRNLARKIANDEDVDVKFSHNVQMLTDFVDTTILVVIAGRGMSKSTVIQSDVHTGVSGKCPVRLSLLSPTLMPI